MTDADAVRRVALALPRAFEQHVGGRWKLKVGRIVFAAFSEDEQDVGFGFPRDEREALVAAAPDVFFMPPARDLRYQWVCAHLAALEEQEMRELVTDAWRMCVPRMLHDLPDLPSPATEAWALLDRGALAEAGSLLHPCVLWQERGTAVRGRAEVVAHLREHPKPRPPHRADIRDGLVFRWVRD